MGNIHVSTLRESTVVVDGVTRRVRYIDIAAFTDEKHVEIQVSLGTLWVWVPAATGYMDEWDGEALVDLIRYTDTQARAQVGRG